MTPATTKPTLNKWKDAKVHTITLPSGTVVEITLPNLPALIKAGQIPNTLLQLVVSAQSGNLDITPEMLAEQHDFSAFIVSKTVKSPEITPEDVVDLPYEDVEMIVDFAMRNRDLDAVGHHFAGLERQSDFRRFRGLDPGFTDSGSL